MGEVENSPTVCTQCSHIIWLHGNQPWQTCGTAQSLSGCFCISQWIPEQNCINNPEAFSYYQALVPVSRSKGKNSSNIVFQFLESIPKFNHIDSPLQDLVFVFHFAGLGTIYLAPHTFEAFIQFIFYTWRMQRVGRHLACLLQRISCIQGHLLKNWPAAFSLNPRCSPTRAFWAFTKN